MKGRLKLLTTGGDIEWWDKDEECEVMMQDEGSSHKAFYGEYSNDEDGFNSLYYADCSAVEAAHFLLRQLEEAHGTKTVHDHGPDQHLKRFTRSIVFFSSKDFDPDSEEGMDTH